MPHRGTPWRRAVSALVGSSWGACTRHAHSMHTACTHRRCGGCVGDVQWQARLLRCIEGEPRPAQITDSLHVSPPPPSPQLLRPERHGGAPAVPAGPGVAGRAGSPRRPSVHPAARGQPEFENDKFVGRSRSCWLQATATAADAAAARARCCFRFCRCKSAPHTGLHPCPPPCRDSCQTRHRYRRWTRWRRCCTRWVWCRAGRKSHGCARHARLRAATAGGGSWGATPRRV